MSGHSVVLRRRVLGVVLLAVTSAVAGTLALAPPGSASTDTVNASADTFAHQEHASENFGDATYLRAKQGGDDYADTQQTYLRFDVTSPPQRAILRLYSTHGDSAGITVSTTSSTWSENTLTWMNRPAIGPKVAQHGGFGKGWIQIDLSPAIRSAGQYSFIITSRDGGGSTFNSRENNNGPQLVLSGATTPTSSVKRPTVTSTTQTTSIGSSTTTTPLSTTTVVSSSPTSTVVSPTTSVAPGTTTTTTPFVSPGSSVTLHYAANTSGGISAMTALGFNLFDIAGSTSSPVSVKATIDALPAGTKALVWVGNLDNAPLGSSCPSPGFSTSQFQSQVNALAGDAKVYGYFLADEPHPSVCASAAPDIKARADYIHAHANGQMAFITVLDGTNMCPGGLGCEYATLAPSRTDVDLIGLDPYPCHYSSGGVAVACDNTVISARVNAALANGVPRSAIVPVYQEFGQEGRTDGKSVYYRTPSASELTSMIDTWSSLVPAPAFDFAYSWGVQCSPASCPSSQALSNHAELQAIAKSHNG